MTIGEGRVSTGTEGRAGSLALSALGAVVGLLGAAWWAFDADPARGRALLVVGVVLAAAGHVVGDRLGRRGQRFLLVVVSVSALLVLADVVHLTQVIDAHGSAHSA